MALTKYKLGDLLQLCEATNENLQYDINSVKGISIQKVFIETKADMTDVSLSPYYLVNPDDFAYVTVTSRNGEKITLAHNTTNNTYIVSSSYVVFRVKRTDLLLSDFCLYILTVLNLTGMLVLILGAPHEKPLIGKICAILSWSFRQ